MCKGPLVLQTSIYIILESFLLCVFKFAPL